MKKSLLLLIGMILLSSQAFAVGAPSIGTLVQQEYTSGSTYAMILKATVNDAYADSVYLFLAIDGGGFVAQDISNTNPRTCVYWDALYNQEVSYFWKAVGAGGTTYSPADAPTGVYSYMVGPGVDEVFGIFFDSDTATRESVTTAPFEQFWAYLYLKHFTKSTAVSGWECHVTVTSTGLAAPTWTLAGGGLNPPPGDSPTGLFSVGVGTGPTALDPVAISGGSHAVLLATYSAYAMSVESTVRFYIGPFPGSVDFVNSPGYIDGDNAGMKWSVGNSSGGDPNAAIPDWSQVCATLNVAPTEVVSDTPTTWSAVKALYQ